MFMRFTAFPNKVHDKVHDKDHPQKLPISEVAGYVASLLNNTPGASSEQIGEALGISERMVRKHIASLRKLGILERIGSNKSGYWKVNRIEEEGGIL